jgi:uncharacterized iron-regulated membrane protein
MKLRPRLRRWHTWLGWVVGIPVFLWAVSGMVMVWRPIEEVRGEHLLREPAPMRMVAPVVPPQIQGVPISSLSLEQRARGPRWVITLGDGTTRIADPRTGTLLPKLSAAEAMQEVTGRYTGRSKVAQVSRTNPDDPPLDLRREIEAWKVTMEDGTNFYVDARSGTVVARRTPWWRFYDFMWGLHIMDPAGREDTHNPWIVGFGLVSVITVILALVLLPLTFRRSRRKAAAPAAE